MGHIISHSLSNGHVPKYLNSNTFLDKSTVVTSQFRSGGNNTSHESAEKQVNKAVAEEIVVIM